MHRRIVSFRWRQSRSHGKGSETVYRLAEFGLTCRWEGNNGLCQKCVPALVGIPELVTEIHLSIKLNDLVSLVEQATALDDPPRFAPWKIGHQHFSMLGLRCWLCIKFLSVSITFDRVISRCFRPKSLDYRMRH